MSAELEAVARIMTEFRLDSVKMPSGLEVLKTTHAPIESSPASPDEVEEAAERMLEARGILNATGRSGRVPASDDEIMFAASSAAAIAPEQFTARPVPDLNLPHEDTNADE